MFMDAIIVVKHFLSILLYVIYIIITLFMCYNQCICQKIFSFLKK